MSEQTLFLTKNDYDANEKLAASKCIIINDNLFSIEYITTMGSPSVNENVVSFAFCYNDGIIKNAFTICDKLNDTSALAFLKTSKILSDEMIRNIETEMSQYGDDSIMTEAKRLLTTGVNESDVNDIKTETTEKFEHFKKTNTEANEKIIAAVKKLYSSIAMRKCNS